MNHLEAIKYLAEHSVYGNEWQGAGMWEAVTTVLATGRSLLTKDYLDILLKRANEK